ncbi:hypothetical protein [Cytophaga aurantiaca]|uniref:hypothetical protein n=1 Tax=Cytophaga aurantiaca TaxID=29530 RepID=UPI001B7F8449|nr:hypothetical protein [Cytophaga aurantiaca]
MSKEDIWKRLHNVTEPYNEKNTSSLFEGSIAENSFRLYQLFDYGMKNQLRPEINGILVQKNEFNEIELAFNLSTEMSIFWWSVFIINITLIIILATTNWLMDCAMFPFGWKVYGGFSLVGYIIALLIYYNKVKECTEKLVVLCKGKIIS